MTTLVQLLEKVQVINREHAALEHEERRAFNIFTILRAEDDEVNLHSRFLFELLNPQGSHGMGTAFLERFLVQAGLDKFDVATATVQREYRNMDMLIANHAQQAIVVENKIYAPDQPKQLERYYKTVRKEGYRDVRVVYLTLYGDAPGEESMGKLDPELVTMLSYQDDVCVWLDACLDVVAAYPMMRETLTQYQRLVEKLTGHALGQRLMDVKALLTDEEHLAAAISIEQALVETKIDVQFGFWLALEEKLIAQGFDVTEYWKYTRKAVEAYYRQGVRRYGLLFSLPEVAGEELLAFFIGVHHRVYYGFAPLERGTPVGVNRQPGFAVLGEILQAVDAGWSASPSLVGWRPAQRALDFYNFNTPDTLSLIDPAKRDVCLDALVDEIIIAIEQFYAACEQDPRLAEQADW